MLCRYDDGKFGNAATLICNQDAASKSTTFAERIGFEVIIGEEAHAAELGHLFNYQGGFIFLCRSNRGVFDGSSAY